MARMTGSMVLALLWVGRPTRMSTSPTLMSWRRKSSVKSVSSANSTSERSFKAGSQCAHGQRDCQYPRCQIRSVAAGTSKTGKGPSLKRKADHRCEEKHSRQTSQSEYFLCGVADPVRPLVRHWRDCSRPKPSPCPIAGHKPAPGDFPGIETRSSPSRTPDLNGESG